MQENDANKAKGHEEALAVANEIIALIRETADVNTVANTDTGIQIHVNGVEVSIMHTTERKSYDSWHFHYTGHGDVRWYCGGQYRKILRGKNGHNVKLAATRIVEAVEARKAEIVLERAAKAAKDTSFAVMVKIQEHLGLRDGSVIRTTPVQDHVEIHLESLQVNEAQATAVLRVLLDQGLLDRYRQ